MEAKLHSKALAISDFRFPEKSKRVFLIKNNCHHVGKKVAFWPAEEFRSTRAVEIVNYFLVREGVEVLLRFHHRRGWSVIAKDKYGEWWICYGDGRPQTWLSSCAKVTEVVGH